MANNSNNGGSAAAPGGAVGAGAGAGVGGGPEDQVLRIRGLPWQATREDIVAFFVGCKIKGGVNGVYMTLSREGRPSGEAYVEMDSEEEMTKGVEFHKKSMGSRYIEVFPSKRSEMDWMVRRSGVTPFNADPNFDGFVRLRGLPFGCKKEDIENFFSGLEVVTDGIVIPVDGQGRATGEAYVQFATREIAEKAMGKHKDKIGHRYIEIFKSSYQEYRAVWNYAFGDPFPGSPPFSGGGGPEGSSYSSPSGGSSSYPPKMRYSLPSTRPSPYDRVGGYNNRGGPQPYGISGGSRGPPPGSSRRSGLWDDYDSLRGRQSFDNRYPYNGPPSPPQYSVSRHMVHMRGLPYKACEQDIFDFFRPLQPLSVRILVDDIGRASGEADVEFSTHDDATKAMNKDKANMQHRYIELFLHSSPSAGGQSLAAASLPQASYNDLGSQYSAAQAVPPPNSSGGSGLLRDTGGGVGSALAGLSLMGGIGLFNSGLHGLGNSGLSSSGHSLAHEDLMRRKQENVMY